jgi:hypothetical protein
MSSPWCKAGVFKQVYMVGMNLFENSTPDMADSVHDGKWTSASLVKETTSNYHNGITFQTATNIIRRQRSTMSSDF